MVGAAIAVFCAALWIRDSTRGYSTPGRPSSPRRAPARADRRCAARGRARAGDAGDAGRGDRAATRARCSSKASTLGLGALIGGLVDRSRARLHGRAGLRQPAPEEASTSGRSTNFPENQYVIAHVPARPERRARCRGASAYIRNNGATDKGPSFTIISNRCAHLGCPVQPNGPVLDDKTKTVKRDRQARDDHPDDPRRRLRLSVPRRPVRPGGQPHRRPARARARPLRVRDQQRPARPARGVQRRERRRDRRRGGDPQVHAQTGPGQHVDGPESWLYPVQPPH